MPAERITVTVSPDLAAAVRSLAAESDRSVSSVVEEALADRLRHHALGRAIREYEEEFGAFSDAELDAIAERKGLQRPTRRAAS
jgi:predicted transcriptional regulator